MPNFLPKYEGHFTSFLQLPLYTCYQHIVQTTDQTQNGKTLNSCTIFPLFCPDNEIYLIRVHLTTKSKPGEQKTTAHYNSTQTTSCFLISQHLFSATQTHQCFCSSTRHWYIQNKKKKKKKLFEKSKPGIALDFFQLEGP